jgi:hypothetical protein
LYDFENELMDKRLSMENKINDWWNNGHIDIFIKKKIL